MVEGCYKLFPKENEVLKETIRTYLSKKKKKKTHLHNQILVLELLLESLIARSIAEDKSVCLWV